MLLVRVSDAAGDADDVAGPGCGIHRKTIADAGRLGNRAAGGVDSYNFV